MEIVISKSDKKNKKYDAVIHGTKTVSFGQKGASDYTKHKDKYRKERYIDRHPKNENWGATGVKTAGFYSKHMLWNKPTTQASIADVNNNIKSLNVKIKKF